MLAHISKSARFAARAALVTGLASAVLTMALSAHASNEPCKVDGDDSALLRCYQSDYQEKFKANESRYKDLVTRAKDQLQDAAEAEAHRQTAAYSELIRKVNHAMLGSRKIAAQECVRIASKFKSQSTSIVAALNCRTEHEVQLEKELRQLEFQLQILASQPQI